jgi:hypothetical protein
MKAKQQEAELEAAKKAEQVKLDIQEQQQEKALERQKRLAQEERDDQERREEARAEKSIDRTVRQQRALKDVDLEFEIKKQEALPPAQPKNGTAP